MTRPHIIRADTLDLQDKTSPTAQDHSQQPEHPAPLGIGPAAPHQQAAIRHVEEERHSEEARLQNAWSNAGSALSNGPGSDDDRTVENNTNGQKSMRMQNEDQLVDLDSRVSGNGDDADMQDADGEEDMDDDMMDKISSSPSIDDGGYSLPCFPMVWPARRESLTPQSSPMPSTTASSSPFTVTPVHFPVSAADASRPFRVLAREPSPLSKSPSPISFSSSPPNKVKSMEHHPGEYAWTRTTKGLEDDTNAVTQVGMSPRSRQLELIERRLQLVKEDSQASLISEVDEEHARSMLPSMCKAIDHVADDPFIGTTVSPPRTTNGTPPPKIKHSDDDQDSWTTDSDADTWDEDQNDDASNDVSFSDDPRFVDSGWGGECLRETEDIDFEFVYALHTFVATVEGQANATKGDTMVLLDDSNSYWWLVRVVKDSSIGYLPAEHIETPTERLARLNKHRNIDLSATMLGDTAEKSKNPLKKAMRRRNAKTVQFAPPTYVEASDYDYSSDEGDGELFGGPAPKQVQQQQEQQQEGTQQVAAEQEEGLKVQPLKVSSAKKDGQSEGETQTSGDDPAKGEDDKQRGSEEMSDRPLDPKVSRNGTLRNTDSFFKDDNTETRKITLTPNILRDDSSTSTTGSRERGASLESLEKNGFGDKAKEDKKKKEKKSGMLSGLFKRKDKKSKGGIDSVDSDIERSEEADRNSPQSKPSEELADRPSAEQAAPIRQTSKGKLQKVNRTRDDSPQQTKGILKIESPTEDVTPAEMQQNPVGKSALQAATMRLVSAEQDGVSKPVSADQPATSNSGSRNPFSAAMKSQSSEDAKPEKVKQAKQRVQLDDFDSEDEGSDPFADPDALAKTSRPQETETTGRLSESPVHISAADAQVLPKDMVQDQDQDQEADPRQPPGLSTDSSSQETNSPVSTPTLDDTPMKTIPENTTLSSFQTDDESAPTHLAPNSAAIPPPSRPAPVPDEKREASSPALSESTMLPAWSDASLRAYLDDGSDIRDMLVVVNDTTGIVPVGPDHPFMKDLFVQETRAMQDLSGQLDRLLSGLMEKRMKRAGSGASKASTARSTSANGYLTTAAR